MEIELKYRIPNEETAEQIWINKSFFHIEEEGSREELCFDARYFDTADGDLNDKEIAYRVRKEGHRWVATVKWSGFSEGGFHQREELNIPVSSDQPDLSVFSESEIGETINKLTEEKELECILQTKFMRRQFRIDTGTGIFEVSIDKGMIITLNGEEPILEVEIELFSGGTDELIELGNKLSETYDLEVESESKYARGLALVNRK